MKRKPGLLEGRGIELEYMMVDSRTLNVLSLSDEVLRSAAGRYTTDYENGSMGWSNEFVCHVMEVKNTAPLPSLNGLDLNFHEQIEKIQAILGTMGGRLMPTGMHPWMNPRKDARLWPHRYRHIYETYDRIFNCRRQGWTNLQSMHINLSFSGDEQFGRLHAAVRLVLPIIPALAASSPVVDGRVTGLQDTRLLYYGRNQRKVPSIMGRIIPEPIFTRAEYEEKILGRMFRDIAAYDSDGVLQHEWLNSRGAIPRYQRSALEIRVTDTQECPRGDIAVAEIVIFAVRQFVLEKWSSFEKQKSWGVEPLHSVFRKTLRDGGKAVIDNERYLKMFGFSKGKVPAQELWKYLLSEAEKSESIQDRYLKFLRIITEEGTLSSRILKSLGKNPSRTRMRNVYEKLCGCLEANKPYTARVP